MRDRSTIVGNFMDQIRSDHYFPVTYMSLSDEADGDQEALAQSRDLQSCEFRQKEFFEELATQLSENLQAAFPGACAFGDTLDLRADEMYAAGSCDLPPSNTPIREAFVRLTVNRNWGPLWIFFYADGMQLCKTLRHGPKCVIFPDKPFGEVGYDNPGFFLVLKQILDHLGFPIPALDEIE